MNTVRSSRSESMYSLPVCGVVTACAPGLPPLAATLMALPSLQFRSIIERPCGIRPLKNDTRRLARKQDIGADGSPNDEFHRLHDRRRNLRGDGAQARQKPFAHLVARRARR